ncbi:MAG: hypothetical protein OEY84_01880 [Rhodospirillaceae bacterium]|nr:hypothetical protein [Rhodospirillaceae bacterium]
MKANIYKILFGIVGAMAISSCAAVPGVDDDPIMRKLSWFSYINGDDMRPNCTAGAGENYRLVYNGIYTEQLRIYQVGGKENNFSVRVINAPDLSDISVAGGTDLLNPWRGLKKEKNISSDEIIKLTAAMENDGVFGSPAVGLRISSKGFFWTIAACHEGNFYFTALRWPGEKFENATFPAALLALDESNIKVNQPRTVRASNVVNQSQTSKKVEGFTLEVGKDGLVGIARF